MDDERSPPGSLPRGDVADKGEAGVAEGGADLAVLLAQAVAAVKAMSPEEHAAMIEAQRQSWVRAEMALGDDKAEAAWIREHMPDLEPSPSLPTYWCREER